MRRPAPGHAPRRRSPKQWGPAPEVELVRAARAVVETTLGELLPHTFSKRHLA
jgi:hypothetical protein